VQLHKLGGILLELGHTRFGGKVVPNQRFFIFSYFGLATQTLELIYWVKEITLNLLDRSMMGFLWSWTHPKLGAMETSPTQIGLHLQINHLILSSHGQCKFLYYQVFPNPLFNTLNFSKLFFGHQSPNCVKLHEIPIVPYVFYTLCLPTIDFYSCHVLIVATNMIQHDMWDILTQENYEFL
jgi:hypothetical protein